MASGDSESARATKPARKPKRRPAKSTAKPRRAAARPAKSAETPVSDGRLLRGQLSRDRILESAVALFSQRGYAATGVDQIARAAGIEKTALYWHFGSKEGLLAAVLDRMDAQFVEQIVKRVAQGGRDSDDRLALFAGGLEQLAREHGHLIRLLLSVSIERSQLSPETRIAMERTYERTRASVARGFEESLGVALPDVDLIARLTLAYLWEAAVREQIDPKGVDHARFFAHFRRLVALDVEHQLAALGVEPAPPRRPSRK